MTDSPDTPPRTPWIIWAAMALSVVFYIWVGRTVGLTIDPPSGDIGPARLILSGISTLLLIAGTLIWRRFGAAKLEAYRCHPTGGSNTPDVGVPWVIGIALVEAAALMTLVLSLVTQDPTPITLGGSMSLTVMLLMMRPHGVTMPKANSGSMPGIDTTDLDHPLDWED
jgi:hypothetical protein